MVIFHSYVDITRGYMFPQLVQIMQPSCTLSVVGVFNWASFGKCGDPKNYDETPKNRVHVHPEARN